MDRELISRSLELVAERHGDPAPLVYARVFAARPDIEALFVRDVSGLVRGQMLMVAIDTLMDFMNDRAYSAMLLQSERINHENLGVPPEVFDTFFRTLMETFRDLLGGDWTPGMDAAWQGLLAEMMPQG